MDSIIWLKGMFRQEMDLRPPSLAKIKKESVIIYDADNIAIAHAAKKDRGNGSEINSLVVDPSFRGRGLSHKLLEKCGDGRLFAYTRDTRLQSALEKAGFVRAATPGLFCTVNVIISRLGIFSWMIFSLEFRRIIHQIKHIMDYKLYVREGSELGE